MTHFSKVFFSHFLQNHLWLWSRPEKNISGYGGRNVRNIMGWDKFKYLTPALDWETKRGVSVYLTRTEKTRKKRLFSDKKKIEIFVMRV